jgi:peptidoglycan/LPS O-acetylase OafA/YrhL
MIELDFIRGIAILMVLVHHYNTDLPARLGLMACGWVGVILFFVLSGFLVGGLLVSWTAFVS